MTTERLYTTDHVRRAIEDITGEQITDPEELKALTGIVYDAQDPRLGFVDNPSGYESLGVTPMSAVEKRMLALLRGVELLNAGTSVVVHSGRSGFEDSDADDRGSEVTGIAYYLRSSQLRDYA